MSSDDAPPPQPTPPLHPRREPFEYGLLPIPKLIFSDPTQTLTQIKHKLLSLSPKADVAAISDALQIPTHHARLVIETIDSVIEGGGGGVGGVEVLDLLVFLYIQSYKRLLPRGHKDSASVADVWPTTSAFDGFLSALSPLQLVRSNSRRFIPSQADEEAHQLSYLQKHLGNILSLLADPVEGEVEGEESLVLPMDKFEHLSFLIYFGEKGSERTPLSQSFPFFANSDPDMPAVPVPAAQVHEWLLQNIASALEQITERASARENGPNSATDPDFAMADVAANSTKALTNVRGSTFVDGISKSSYVKQASDIKGCSLKILNCHESVIYILAPLKYATIYGCSDATIVIGAVGKAVRVEHCERVHVIVAAKRISIANCRECVFFLGVNQQPLIVGDNHKLQVAPYNTFYTLLDEHLKQVGIDPNINKWDEPIALGVVDPHDSLSHPAGVSDVQTESATRIDPDQFTNFLIPNDTEHPGSTKANPFPLPESYMASQQRNCKNLEEVKQILRESKLEDSRKRELANALHTCFKDWLYASGNIRQLFYLQGE
ncbi:hypothetical protein LIER_16198 [Lithospermum erythrorhizon]|uniref:TBCC domain-containing protein 1 n=1 Tax=Lithospermum erythrorhizon TaxID=34254 RepID=A0AAV3Q8A8_LITER